MPHMYILECADGSYYTGSTWNLEKRLWEHQNGLGANHTKKHLPVKLVYCEYYDRVEDAFHREKQVQGWSRHKKQALMEGNKEKLIEYARNSTQYGNPAAASTSSASATISASATGVWGSASLPSTSSGNEADPHTQITQALSECVESDTNASKHTQRAEEVSR